MLRILFFLLSSWLHPIRAYIQWQAGFRRQFMGLGDYILQLLSKLLSLAAAICGTRVHVKRMRTTS